MLLDNKFTYSANELKDIAERKRKADKEERFTRAKEWVRGAIKEYCLPKAKIGWTDVTFKIPCEMQDCTTEIREVFEILHYTIQQKDKYTFQIFWRS